MIRDDDWQAVFLPIFSALGQKKNCYPGRLPPSLLQPTKQILRVQVLGLFRSLRERVGGVVLTKGPVGWEELGIVSKVGDAVPINHRSDEKSALSS